ncbi:conserved protein of unknown function [Pseudoalteromonas translucida]|jgi:hypothetical protein|uniref:Uncharacterized protein n=3 Tax=Pseudoalteromonas TaxID=53246 RepID=Q3IHZ0_PSET1|nr:conserved protein of unknown function [Pseudoalteromonas translucida]|tara:strand:+ start:5696 stop:5959 length:264 start_codon:yes stop_codon:yes gene_type:complete
MCVNYIFTLINDKHLSNLDIICAFLIIALGENMLKRKRTQRFKRKTINSTATRRRVMLRNLHKKIIWRRRMFAMQKMAELDALMAAS